MDPQSVSTPLPGSEARTTSRLRGSWSSATRRPNALRRKAVLSPASRRWPHATDRTCGERPRPRAAMVWPAAWGPASRSRSRASSRMGSGLERFRGRSRPSWRALPPTGGARLRDGGRGAPTPRTSGRRRGSTHPPPGRSPCARGSRARSGTRPGRRTARSPDRAANGDRRRCRSWRGGLDGSRPRRRAVRGPPSIPRCRSSFHHTMVRTLDGGCGLSAERTTGTTRVRAGARRRVRRVRGRRA